ncbi:MAG: hypothetical protein JNM56_27330, partial [Planctomycetia bacterium]|nr:hypothetical protein [Planctomycetia bacterium]
MRRALAAVLVVLCLIQPAWLHAGGFKLLEVRNEVRQEKKPDARKQEAADDDKDDDDWSFGDSGDSIVIEGLWGTLATSCWLLGTSIYVLPANCLGDHYHTEFGFGRYPYADDSLGLMCNLASPTARLGIPQPTDDIQPTEWRVELPPPPERP